MFWILKLYKSFSSPRRKMSILIILVFLKPVLCWSSKFLDALTFFTLFTLVFYTKHYLYTLYSYFVEIKILESKKISQNDFLCSKIFLLNQINNFFFKFTILIVQKWLTIIITKQKKICWSRFQQKVCRGSIDRSASATKWQSA